MANEAFSQDQRPIKVTAPLGTGKDVLLLAGFSGQEAVSQLFNFQLEVVGVNKKLAELGAPAKDPVFDKVLGQKVTVELALPGSGNKRFFSGICSRVTQGERDKDLTSYHLELVPQLWLLTRRAQSRIFQQTSVKDILKKVLEGLDVDFEIDEKDKNVTLAHPRDYCVQYRETDFNFASRLMEEEGIFYFFKHTADGHRMVVANSPSSHPPVAGAPLNEIVYQLEALGGDATRDPTRIQSWSKVQELRAGKVTLRDQCFEKIASNRPPIFQDLTVDKPHLESVKVGEVTHQLLLAKIEKIGAHDKLEVYDYPGEYAQRFDGVNKAGGDQSKDLDLLGDDAQRTVDIRMQQEALPSLMIQGASNGGQLLSGHRFKLKKHFNGDGEYLLTSVFHSAQQATFRTGQPVEFSYSNSFTCIPAAVPYRPAQVTPKPVVSGTQTAVVVGSGADKEELLVDRFGRVKVQFHWDRAGPHNKDPQQATHKNSSCWVRVAQPWAGKGWGGSFWPRIGQEVVVAFLEGDPDQPIIVGSVYNADQVPPYLGLPSKQPSPDPKHKHNPHLSGVKSNTTLGGEGFNEWRFDDTKDKQQVFLHAERNMDTRVKNDCMEQILHHRHLIVGAEKDGKKDGDQRELVFKDKHLHVKGNHVEHVEGSMLLLVGGGEGEAGNQDIVIKNTKKELIEKDSHLHVKLNRNEKVDMDQSLTIGMNQQEKVGMNHALEAGMAIHIKAGMTLVLEAGIQLTLKAGGSFIDLSPAGVAINGMPMVMINSGGAAGAGAGSNPTAAEDAKEAKPTKPDEADNAVSGKKSAPK